jgi:hypothetical protein
MYFDHIHTLNYILVLVVLQFEIRASCRCSSTWAMPSALPLYFATTLTSSSFFKTVCRRVHYAIFIHKYNAFQTYSLYNTLFSSFPLFCWFPHQTIPLKQHHHHRCYFRTRFHISENVLFVFCAFLLALKKISSSNCNVHNLILDG